MSYLSYQTVVNSFEYFPDYKLMFHLAKSIRGNVQIDKETYLVGELVTGKICLTLDQKLALDGLLCVLDGTIISRIPGAKSRYWTEPVTNMHIFTDLIKPGRHKMYMVVGPGSYAFPFGLQIPCSNLPGSMDSKFGRIKYRIFAAVSCFNLDNCCYVFATLAEKSFTLRPYMSLGKEIPELATQSWQTKKWFQNDKCHKFKVSAVNPDPGMSCKEKYNSFSRLKKSDGKFELRCTIPSTSVITGEEVPFEMQLDNPNAEIIESIKLGIVQRIIYTAMEAHITSKELISVTCPTCPLSTSSIIWNDKLIIPSDLESGSTLAAIRQPIIFQYILEAEIKRRGKSNPFIGNTVLVIGTTRNSTHSKPVKCILDLNQCPYPVGVCEMYYPEDWDKMYKTGRIGYIRNPNLAELNANANVPVEYVAKGIGRRCPSVASFTSASSFASASSLASVSSANTSSTSKSKPPRYSALSSRRSSEASGLPTYSKALEITTSSKEI